MLPPTRTATTRAALLIDALATAPIPPDACICMPPPGPCSALSPPASQACSISSNEPWATLLLAEVVRTTAIGGGVDRHLSIRRRADEDRAAVRVNREAERRKGHWLTATNGEYSSIVALPSQRGLERPWILHPPATEALRLGHARAEGQRGIGQEQECLLRRHVHEASLHLRSCDDRDACPARHDDDIALGRFDDAAACGGQGLRVGTRHRDCGQEYEGNRHEPSAGHVDLPESKRGPAGFPARPSSCHGPGESSLGTGSRLQEPIDRLDQVRPVSERRVVVVRASRP